MSSGKRSSFSALQIYDKQPMSSHSLSNLTLAFGARLVGQQQHPDLASAAPMAAPLLVFIYALRTDASVLRRWSVPLAVLLWPGQECC